MKESGMEFRHEYKFMLSVTHAACLKAEIAAIMDQDEHAGGTGSYEIRSIYFDDWQDTCFKQNEAGTDPRQKYRIRAYNGSDEVILLEKKIKRNGMTKKLHQRINKDQYELLLADTDSLGEEFHSQPDLVKELLMLKQARQMRPKVIVAYQRTPFVEKSGNVRITFDDGISSSPDFSDFFKEQLHRRPVMPVGETLMEIKFDEFLPTYIKETLGQGDLSQTTFSKYYLCRRYSL